MTSKLARSSLLFPPFPRCLQRPSLLSRSNSPAIDIVLPAHYFRRNTPPISTLHPSSRDPARPRPPLPSVASASRRWPLLRSLIFDSSSRETKPFQPLRQRASPRKRTSGFCTLWSPRSPHISKKVSGRRSFPSLCFPYIPEELTSSLTISVVLNSQDVSTTPHPLL